MKKGIEYADKSWNPYHGCEMTDCKVGKNCWAYKRAKMLGANPKVKGYPAKDPFRPVFEINKLDIPLKRKKPTRWDTCFMGDIAYCAEGWLSDIHDVVRSCPQHIFYFLTKLPDKLADKGLVWPDNAWVGVTVNCQDDTWRIQELKRIHCKNRWVSFEPLYSSVIPYLDGVDFVVIGAQSNPELQPNKKWVDNIIHMAEYRGIPIFIKPNLTVVEPRMELPEVLKVS